MLKISSISLNKIINSNTSSIDTLIISSIFFFAINRCWNIDARINQNQLNLFSLLKHELIVCDLYTRNSNENRSVCVVVNVVDGEVLHIVKISRLHMGAYLCIASNDVPPRVSQRISLRVQCEYTEIFPQIYPSNSGGAACLFIGLLYMHVNPKLPR